MEQTTPTAKPNADPFFTGQNGLPMGFVRPAALARYLGVSVPTLYRWEREGLFPRRNKMPGVSCTVWRWSDIHAWTDANVQTAARPS